MPPVVSADDAGAAEIAGADQIAGRLAATPDDRLAALVAVLRFIDEARAALPRAR